MIGLRLSVILFTTLILAACGSVKTNIENEYQLERFSNQHVKQKSAATLLINAPTAIANFQTEAMMYVKKPFELAPFAHSAWIDTPANMLFPLIVQSIESAGFFHSIAASPNSEIADYTLDTQLISLRQNFLTKPSHVDFIVRVTLNDIANNRILASRIFGQHIPCPQDTPYGGVIAANEAAYKITADITAFVINLIKKQ